MGSGEVRPSTGGRLRAGPSAGVWLRLAAPGSAPAATAPVWRPFALASGRGRRAPGGARRRVRVHGGTGTDATARRRLERRSGEAGDERRQGDGETGRLHDTLGFACLETMPWASTVQERDIAQNSRLEKLSYLAR